MPKCRRCQRPSVFDPCRSCGTEAELAEQDAPAAPPPIDRSAKIDLPPVEAKELPPRFAGQSPVEHILDGLRATKENRP